MYTVIMLFYLCHHLMEHRYMFHDCRLGKMLVTHNYNQLELLIHDDSIYSALINFVIFLVLQTFVVCCELPCIWFLCVTEFCDNKMFEFQERFTGCGGTLIGQELFKLIVIDTVVMVRGE